MEEDINFEENEDGRLIPKIGREKLKYHDLDESTNNVMFMERSHTSGEIKYVPYEDVPIEFLVQKREDEKQRLETMIDKKEEQIETPVTDKIRGLIGKKTKKEEKIENQTKAVVKNIERIDRAIEEMST